MSQVDLEESMKMSKNPRFGINHHKLMSTSVDQGHNQNFNSRDQNPKIVSVRANSSQPNMEQKNRNTTDRSTPNRQKALPAYKQNHWGSSYNHH